MKMSKEKLATISASTAGWPFKASMKPPATFAPSSTAPGAITQALHLPSPAHRQFCAWFVLSLRLCRGSYAFLFVEQIEDDVVVFLQEFYSCQQHLSSSIEPTMMLVIARGDGVGMPDFNLERL